MFICGGFRVRKEEELERNKDGEAEQMENKVLENKVKKKKKNVWQGKCCQWKGQRKCNP